jgi:hypothetical protein
MRGEVVTLHLHAEPIAIARAVETYLVQPNEEFLSANPDLPGILDSGALYTPDFNEDWMTYPWILHGGIFDCEDATGIGVAEDRVRRGIPSVACVYRNSTLGMHCCVARPRGNYSDPFAKWIIGHTRRWTIVDLSRALGMGRKKKPCFCP